MIQISEAEFTIVTVHVDAGCVVFLIPRSGIASRLSTREVLPAVFTFLFMPTMFDLAQHVDVVVDRVGLERHGDVLVTNANLLLRLADVEGEIQRRAVVPSTDNRHVHAAVGLHLNRASRSHASVSVHGEHAVLQDAVFNIAQGEVEGEFDRRGVDNTVGVVVHHTLRRLAVVSDGGGVGATTQEGGHQHRDGEYELVHDCLL